MNILGAISYSQLFILLYRKYSKVLCFFEAYGKLGLTNYIMQNVVGVVLCYYLLSTNNISLVVLLAVFILFYIIQTLFSCIWLRYYKFGPIEYVWRIITNLRLIANKLDVFKNE